MKANDKKEPNVVEISEAIWKGGFKTLCKKNSENPFKEEVAINIKNGSGDFVKEATLTHWFDLIETVREANEDYIDKACDEMFRVFFEEAISKKGECYEVWMDILSRLEIEEEFEEEFEKSLKEDVLSELRDHALEEGVYYFVDLDYSLEGSAEGSYEDTFDLVREYFSTFDCTVPTWTDPKFAKEWVNFFMLFNIDPLDFVKEVKKNILSKLEQCDENDDQAVLEKEEIIQKLIEQGMLLSKNETSEYPPKNPALWEGGLAEIAKGFALLGASSINKKEGHFKKLDDFVEKLNSDSGAWSAEIYFGISGYDLEKHSELTDRLGSEKASELCFESCLARQLSIAGPEIYLNEERYPFEGSLILNTENLYWKNSSAEDENTEGFKVGERSIGNKVARLKSLIATESRLHKENMSEEVKKIIKDLVGETPHAMESVLELYKEDQSALSHQIKEVYEACKENREFSLKKTGAKFPEIKKLTLEDFNCSSPITKSAPWRYQVEKEMQDLVGLKDEMGNTIAHKACAGKDVALLRKILQVSPDLSDIPNIGGYTPLDLVLNYNESMGFEENAIELCKVILEKRPDLANKKNSQGITVFSWMMKNERSLTVNEFKKMLELGVEISHEDKESNALMNMIPEKFNQLIECAIKMGWDVNKKDSRGNTLAHKVFNVNKAMSLLNLGADFSIKNKQGESGGFVLMKKYPEDYSKIEASILNGMTKEVDIKKRSLSL